MAHSAPKVVKTLNFNEFPFFYIIIYTFGFCCEHDHSPNSSKPIRKIISIQSGYNNQSQCTKSGQHAFLMNFRYFTLQFTLRILAVSVATYPTPANQKGRLSVP